MRVLLSIAAIAISTIAMGSGNPFLNFEAGDFTQPKHPSHVFIPTGLRAIYIGPRWTAMPGFSTADVPPYNPCNVRDDNGNWHSIVAPHPFPGYYWAR